MGLIRRIKRRIEERVDKAEQDYTNRRRGPVNRRAQNEYSTEMREINSAKQRGVSQKRTDRWEKEAHERYKTRRIPIEERAASALVGAAKSGSEGVRKFRDEAPKRYRTAQKSYSRSTWSMLGETKGAGAYESKGYKSPKTYGGFLVTGRQSGKLGSTGGGSGILYGPRGKGRGGKRRGRRVDSAEGNPWGMI